MIDETCRIPDRGLLYVPQSSRIDAFCVLTGIIDIGEYVHIGSGSKLIGSGGRITIHNCAGMSLNCCLFTASDNYAGTGLIGPTFPSKYRDIKYGNIVMMPASALGANSVVMPGVTIGFGAVIGANSFVRCNIPDGEIWAGNPAKKVGSRDLQTIIQRYEDFLATECT